MLGVSQSWCAGRGELGTILITHAMVGASRLEVYHRSDVVAICRFRFIIIA